MSVSRLCTSTHGSHLKDQPLDELEAAAATVTAPISYTGASGSDDYYQTVAINSLLGILKDQSLSGQHHTVIEAIMSIFKTQGLKCATFLPQVNHFCTWCNRTLTHSVKDYPCFRYRHSELDCPSSGIPFTTDGDFGGNHQTTCPELYA
jgi:hypothetical protein